MRVCACCTRAVINLRVVFLNFILLFGGPGPPSSGACVSSCLVNHTNYACKYRYAASMSDWCERIFSFSNRERIRRKSQRGKRKHGAHRFSRRNVSARYLDALGVGREHIWVPRTRRPCEYRVFERIQCPPWNIAPQNKAITMNVDKTLRIGDNDKNQWPPMFEVEIDTTFCTANKSSSEYNRFTSFKI